MRIHHIAMRTRQLARLEEFYARVLRLPVAQRDGARSVWLHAGDAIVMIEQAEEGEPSVPAGSLDLVAFTIDVTEIDRWRRTLAAQEIAVEGETAYTIYFRDPDGRRVALSHFPGEGTRTSDKP